jgi:hypothetical protein
MLNNDDEGIIVVEFKNLTPEGVFFKNSKTIKHYFAVC